MRVKLRRSNGRDEYIKLGAATGRVSALPLLWRTGRCER